MDLRHPVLPSSVVTSANRLNAVTTYPSSVFTNSSFGRPVTTAVQAHQSIRSIQPNIVKSRAQQFEEKDTGVTKETVPAKAITGGNFFAKISASPLSAKIPATVENRHSFVQQSKSVGHLEHTGVSPVPSVRLRNKTTKFSFDMEDLPSPTHRDLRPVSSVGVSRHLSPETPSDIVAQRLQMFENKPVMSNKPMPLPKPRSLCSDFDANRVAVCHSKSGDSVKQSDVNCQVNVSFHLPPADRAQAGDDTSCMSSQDATLKTPHISYLHANDVGAKRRSAARQVKEVVVISPSPSRQLNETLLVNTTPSSSVTETSKAISPKPPQKPQLKKTIVSPSPSSRPTNPLTPSSPETSKIVAPKAPEKPPRSAGVSADPVTPTNDDSYGLLVCDAGAATPSVHVGKLSPDIFSPVDHTQQNISGKHVADMCNRLESHSEGKPTCSAPKAVLNTSRLQNTSAVQANIASQSSSVSDDWEKKFIRGPKSTPVVRSRGEKENFVTKRRINNPSYMYVSMLMDDIIPSQQKTFADKKALTRHHSDDMLNIPPSPKSPSYKQPLYAVPFDFIDNAANDAIVFDSAGYAMPFELNTPQLQHSAPAVPPRQRNYVQKGITPQQRHNIQAKVSNAYSILRLDLVPPDNFETSLGGDSVAEQESDAEIDLEAHRRLLRHVSKVKEATNKDVSNYQKVRLRCDGQRLFEYAMIVTLQASDVGLQPCMLFCFPQEVSASCQLSSYFCFPEADEIQPMCSYLGESFSFLLTNESGGRKYGWCCRYLPPGDGPRLPEALVIVSQIGEKNLYQQLLEKVRTCRFMSITSAEEMLQVAYARPFPAPNNEVYIRTVGPDFAKLTFIIKRDAETPYNNVSFATLLSHLSIEKLLQVFAALLLERKLIFCSRHLSTLSTCMTTMAALLYPFEWQHTFITVLPSMLIDIVDAPTPYVVGILASMKDLLEDHYFTEVLFVDLDAKRLHSAVGDEGRIIPKRIQKALIAALSDDTDGSGPSAGCLMSSVSNEATVAEAFLRMFVETCGHYDSYINTQQNGEKIFQRELFVKVVSSRSIRMFLEWFTLTQMFDVFITDRLKDDFMPGYFEKRVMDYRDEMKQLTSPLRENMKVFGKKIVGFLRDYGGKIKKSFQKDVYV